MGQWLSIKKEMEKDNIKQCGKQEQERERYTHGPNHQLYTININSYYTSSIVIIHYYNTCTEIIRTLSVHSLCMHVPL